MKPILRKNIKLPYGLKVSFTRYLDWGGRTMRFEAVVYKNGGGIKDNNYLL